MERKLHKGQEQRQEGKKQIREKEFLRYTSTIPKFKNIKAYE